MSPYYELNGINQKWKNYQATGNAFAGYENYWLREGGAADQRDQPIKQSHVS